MPYPQQLGRAQLHRPLVGLSLMLEDDFLRATLPLFEAGEVEVLEWSFDIGWGLPALPAWADELLGQYSRAGRLLGHGVTFSALSAAWTPRQAAWLDRLRHELAERSYLHVSEHFGFMTAGDFHRSAPLPVPLTDASLRIGQERLQMLADCGARPVGLENLAFAFGRQDVADQGRFLDRLLEPVNGFVLLDLHNLYCQSCNFGIPIAELLDLYPLSRVRELHISGGSWSSVTGTDPANEDHRQGRAGGSAPTGNRVRRDTHDGPVPEEVFAAVPQALARCPAVTAVIFERLGGTLHSPADEAALRDDYRRLCQVVGSACHV
jgi:uncharacterized protein (UPF0276 family)